MANAGTGTLDPSEVAKFSAMAQTWWDAGGPFRPLHKLNPYRIGLIRDEVCARFGRDRFARRPLEGLRVLDVGCGGGLGCEPMARLGAQVVGLDAAAENVAVARVHAEQAALAVDYRAGTVEALAASGEPAFDVVLALEIVEHVADVPLFLSACSGLVAPGGMMALATLNRTALSLLTAKIGAEYVLGWLPRGTHDWSRFVTPEEAHAGLATAGLQVTRTAGFTYRPLLDAWRIGDDTRVNYMVFAGRDT